MPEGTPRSSAGEKSGAAGRGPEKKTKPPGSGRRTDVRVPIVVVEPPPERMVRAKRWALVTARDLMRKNVVTVDGSAPLSEVERILSDQRISGAPVTDEGGRIIGILSLRDLVARYTEDPDARPRRGHGFYELSTEELSEEDYEAFEVPEESEETARDIMTAEIYTVPEGASLEEIAAVMVNHRIHRVLVESEGKFVGLISTLEILDALSA
jgi:CBS domain-containing protein